MAEDTESNADPSMEEILASIRKIISDDAPPVQAEPEPVPEPEPEPELPQEEVLELTQMIQDDGSVTDLSEPVEEEPPPPPPPPPPPSSPPLSAGEPLISEPTANSAASAFSSFANSVDIGRMGGGNRATFLGNGSRTLEDMVIELMRPLLKEWLDQNLPAIVERLVQKEIERISHRS